MMGKKWIVALSLLCILSVLLLGCSSSGEAMSIDNIQLSNIKFSDAKMSGAAKSRVADIQNLLQELSVKKIGVSNAKIIGENTLPYDVDLELFLCWFDQDGRLTESSTVTTGLWESGQPIDILFYCSSGEIASIKIAARFAFEESYYQTDLVPAHFDTDGDITIKLQSGPLPYTITVSPVSKEAFKYTVTELFPGKQNNSEQWMILLRKDAGKDNASEEIPYRILDEDGHVWKSGGLNMCIKVGEMILESIPCYDLQPGVYYLELGE